MTDKETIAELRERVKFLEDVVCKVADRDITEPDYSWCDWLGDDAASEVRKIYSEFAMRSLEKYREQFK